MIASRLICVQAFPAFTRLLCDHVNTHVLVWLEYESPSPACSLSISNLRAFLEVGGVDIPRSTISRFFE